MINRYLLILLIGLVINTNCIQNRKLYNIDAPFIMDTTLSRCYTHDIIPSYIDLYNKAIITHDELKEKVGTVLYPIVEKKIITMPNYFITNLVQDSIWVVKGINKPLHNDEIGFGNAIYLEIAKKDGSLIKCIIEE